MSTEKAGKTSQQQEITGRNKQNFGKKKQNYGRRRMYTYGYIVSYDRIRIFLYASLLSCLSIIPLRIQEKAVWPFPPPKTTHVPELTPRPVWIQGFHQALPGICCIHSLDYEENNESSVRESFFFLSFRHTIERRQSHTHPRSLIPKPFPASLYTAQSTTQ